MKLALLGFGNVGRGLATLLLKKRDYLKQRYDFECTVVGIYDLNLGGVLDPEGIDLQKLLDIVSDGGMIEDYPGADEDLISLGLIEKSGADVLVEMTFTDLESGQPAVSHCQQALAGGIHVVTSNKGPAAFARKDLWELAKDNKAFFRFEGSVMSGTPVISLITSSMAGVELTGFRGILNSTSNYILSRMEEGSGFDAALREAVDKGFAEANNRIDVDGWDAAAKGVILANALMDGDLMLDNVPREGIRKLTSDDIESARKDGKRWRMIVECTCENGELELKVEPQRLNAGNPLAAVKGSGNAITFNTDVMGDVTIHGRGAGRVETGFAILSDLLWIHRRLHGMAYSY